MAINLITLVKNIGLSDKAAKVYLAALELGEATVQELAKRACVKRTTIYSLLGDLTGFGALLRTKRGKKYYYLAEEPVSLLKRSRERLSEFEDNLPALEERKHAVYRRPRVFFLYGPAGFKQAWDIIFSSSEEEFLITTPAESFLDFVAEKYILDEIIKTKRRLGLHSRQLITDSPYARKLVAKDFAEGRSSKFLSSRYPLLFTEIVSAGFVVLIAPRLDNFIMVVESDSFAKTRRNLFETLWDALPSAKFQSHT